MITHGVRDDVLPIDRTGRRLVPALLREQYLVDHREFDGCQVVPPELAEQAADRLADDSSSGTALWPRPAGGEHAAGTAPPVPR